MAEDHAWLRDLVTGQTVGIETNTYLYKTYTLAKVAKITPTGIIRLVTLATPSGRGMIKYNFRMDNRIIREKSNNFSTSTIKIVEYDFALEQIEAQKLTQQKKEYTYHIAMNLKEHYEKIPLALLEVIQMKLLPYIK